MTYQKQPAPLALDGVAELHRELFRRLDALTDPARRAESFLDYLEVAFRLQHPEEAGYSGRRGRARPKATWARVLRGWAFDADGVEGAVMKGWVESRFGLTPRHHGEVLRDPNDAAFLRYQEMRARGLYGTNALEAQLDLVYSFCQYEYARQWPTRTHQRLFRGVNRVDAHETLAVVDRERRIVLLNNLCSFTANRERAGEFGDYILSANIPVAKILLHCRLLPSILKGEDEFLVIGGAYEVGWSTL